MAAAAILDFQFFYFFTSHRVLTVFLRIAVKFGDDQSTQSKVASIFRNFCFGLNFPFEGLFGEVLGVGDPQRGPNTILTPKRHN